MSRATTPLHHLVSAVGLAAGLSILGCGGSPALGGADRPSFPATEPAALAPQSTCVVEVGTGVTTLRVTPTGLALAHAEGGSETLTRYDGMGCELELRSDLPVLAMHDQHVDIDDAGNVYVTGTDSVDPSVLSTQVDSNYGGIIRVDAAGELTPLVQGGRWIADLSVAATGDELATHGCSPTGVFRPAEDRWVQAPTASRHWNAVSWRTALVSVGDGAVLTTTADEVVRIDDDGVEALGPSTVDFGTGLETAQRISRCGTGLCAVFSSGLATWSGDGALRARVSLTQLGAATTEVVEWVSGDGRGVYALLRGEAGTRVVFVPSTLLNDLRSQ